MLEAGGGELEWRLLLDLREQAGTRCLFSQAQAASSGSRVLAPPHHVWAHTARFLGRTSRQKRLGSGPLLSEGGGASGRSALRDWVWGGRDAWEWKPRVVRPRWVVGGPREALGGGELCAGHARGYPVRVNAGPGTGEPDPLRPRKRGRAGDGAEGSGERRPVPEGGWEASAGRRRCALGALVREDCACAGETVGGAGQGCGRGLSAAAVAPAPSIVLCVPRRVRVLGVEGALAPLSRRRRRHGPRWVPRLLSPGLRPAMRHRDGAALSRLLLPRTLARARAKASPASGRVWGSPGGLDGGGPGPAARWAVSCPLRGKTPSRHKVRAP